MENFTRQSLEKNDQKCDDFMKTKSKTDGYRTLTSADRLALRNSQALEDYRQRPITPDQLQTEMGRIAIHKDEDSVR